MNGDGSYPCDQPGCEHVAASPATLGLHRRNVHGIAGSKRNKARRPRADRPPRDRPAAAPAARKPKYAPALEAYCGMVGMAFSAAAMARQSPQLAYDGQVIMAGAAEWAQAWERLAAEDPKVARVLDVVCSTTRWTEVSTATAAIVVPILACHRVIPPQAAVLFGHEQPPEPPTPDPTTNGHADGVAPGFMAGHDAGPPGGNPPFVG